MLAFRLEQLREGFAMRRLVRRGVPIRTPTYLIDDHLIWGATARILGELLQRRECVVAAQQARGDALDRPLAVRPSTAARESGSRPRTAAAARAAASPG